MAHTFRKIRHFIEEFSPGSYSLIVAVPIVLLVVGYLIWNSYLYTFGFVEDQLLRGRFILTGAGFFLLTFWGLSVFTLAARSVEWLAKKVSPVFRFLDKKGTFSRNRTFPSFVIFYAVASLSLFWWTCYVIGIFPTMPMVLGGGQPRSLSLISSELDMALLNSIQISRADGAEYQTINLCVFHENSQAIYVIQDNRVLMLDRSLFSGHGSLPGVKVLLEQSCIDSARGWVFTGLYSSVKLFWVSFKNLIAPFYGGERIQLVF